MAEVNELMNELNGLLSSEDFEESLNDVKYGESGEVDDDFLQRKYFLSVNIVEEILYKYTSFMVENKEFHFQGNRLNDIEYALILSPTKKFLEQTNIITYVRCYSKSINHVKLLLIIKYHNDCRIMITYNDNLEFPYDGDVYVMQSDRELIEEELGHMFENKEDLNEMNDLDVFGPRSPNINVRQTNIFYFEPSSFYTSLKYVLNVSNMECQLKDMIRLYSNNAMYALEHTEIEYKPVRALIELVRFLYVNMDFINKFNDLIDGNIGIRIIDNITFYSRGSGCAVDIRYMDDVNDDDTEVIINVKYYKCSIMYATCESTNEEFNGDMTGLATEILDSFLNREMSYELLKGREQNSIYPEELSDVIYSFMYQ